MKTIAIIDDDIHIGDMLREVLVQEAILFFVHTPAQKRYIFFHKTSPIWCCWI